MKRTFTFLMVSLLAFVGVKAEVAADLVGKYFSVAEPATALQTDTWYLLRNQGRNAYISEEADAVKMKSTSAVAAVADADANAGILFKFAAGANEGQYSIVSGNGNYLTFGSSSSAVSASAVDYIIGSIAEGYWYMQDPTTNIVADGNAAGGTFVGWGTSVPTSASGNNVYQFLEVALFDEAVMTTLSKAAGMAYDLQVASGLVTDASKFSSNAKEPSEGTFGALIDGEYTSFFHSAYSVSVDGAHYLQAEVNEPVKDFFFYFKKRSHNNNNRPTDITVLGSNDGQEFKEITTINTGFPTDAADLDYASAVINASEAYKHFRFVVNQTNSSSVFFTFSEFYLLPADKVEALAAAQALVAAGPTAENFDELAAEFETICNKIQADKVAKLHEAAVAEAEAVLASVAHASAPALGQYPTASYDTFKAAVEELKAEATQENVDAIKAALVAFEATKNLPLFTIDSQKDYAAGQSIYENENGGLNFKATDVADKSMLWAFDMNATEVGLTDKVVVRNAATGNLFWGASFISVIETEPAVEGDGVFMFKTEGTGAPVHAQQSGSSIVRWSAADANCVGGASTWKFTFVGVSNPAAYDLSEVAASFKEQAMAFAGLQENAALSALPAVQEKWAEGMGVVEPLFTAVEAGELVLKADVEAAMEMMSGIQAVVAYYAGTYSEKLAEAEEFLATLEEGSDRYVAWDAAIVEYKTVSAVTAVKELEDKVAALAEAFANLPEDEPEVPEVPVVTLINFAAGGNCSAVSGTFGDVSFATDKGTATNAPAYNANSQELRVYRYTNLTITSAPTVISKIVIKCTSSKYMGADAIVVKAGESANTASAIAAENIVKDTEALTYTITVDGANYVNLANLGSENVQLRIKSIEVTHAKAAEEVKVGAPDFSVAAGNLFASTSLVLTAEEGATIYWSTDNETFAPYTEPIAIDASCTVYAYAEKDGVKSVVASSSYVMAVTCASIAELLAVETTSDGVPVIVKLEAVVDSFGLNKNNEIVSVFLIEGTDTLMVYDYNIPADYVKGNVVKGQLAGLWKDYYGTLELCNVDYSGATVEEPENLAVVGATVGDVAIVEGAATVESISSFDITFDRPVALAEDAEWATLTDQWGDNSLKAEVLADNNCVVRFSLQWLVIEEAGDFYLYIPEGVVVDAEDANCINAAIEAVITVEAAPATPLIVTNVTVGEDVMEGFTAVATTEDVIKVNFDGEFYFQGTPVIKDAEGNDASMSFDYMNGRDMDGSNSYVFMGKNAGIYTITLPKASFMQMMSFKAPAEDIVLTVQITFPDGIDNISVGTDAVIYDLSGRRVTEMKKGGIYIVNGKKVIK